jgi:hypothetical protein
MNRSRRRSRDSEEATTEKFKGGCGIAPAACSRCITKWATPGSRSSDSALRLSASRGGAAGNRSSTTDAKSSGIVMVSSDIDAKSGRIPEISQVALAVSVTLITSSAAAAGPGRVLTRKGRPSWRSERSSLPPPGNRMKSCKLGEFKTSRFILYNYSFLSG